MKFFKFSTNLRYCISKRHGHGNSDTKIFLFEFENSELRSFNNDDATTLISIIKRASIFKITQALI